MSHLRYAVAVTIALAVLVLVPTGASARVYVGPNLDITPNTLVQFPATIAGYPEDQPVRTITIKSIGHTPLIVEDVTFTTYPAGAFQLLEPDKCVGTLPRGETCQMEVKFTPTVPMPNLRNSATIKLDLPGYPWNESREIELSGFALTSGYVISPTFADFGDAAIGSRAWKPITIVSSGTGPLPFYGYSISGRDADSFDIAPGQCSSWMLRSDNCTIEAFFNPEPGPPGNRIARLTVDAYDTEHSQKAILLNGVAPGEPSPPLREPELDLDLNSPKAVTHGKTLVVEAAVKNTGDAVAQYPILKTVVPAKFAKEPKAIKVKAIAVGRTITRRIRVKVKRSAEKGKQMPVKVIVTAPGAAKLTKTLKVKIR